MLFHPSRHRWCAFHDLLKPVYVARPRAYYSCLVVLALAYALEFATFAACDAPTEQQLRRAFRQISLEHHPNHGSPGAGGVPCCERRRADHREFGGL